jgi:probable phosphoglycerate mutase
VENKKSENAALVLKKFNITPTKVYSSPLKRTKQTAEIILSTLGLDLPIVQDEIFSEIDYGADENKSEAEVISRIGKGAIEVWDKFAIPPEGWIVDPQEIISSLQKFAKNIKDDESVLVVSSNGIIRFAPYILEDYENVIKNIKLKVATGGVCIFRDQGDGWQILEWGV